MSGRFGVLLPLRIEKQLDLAALAARFDGAEAWKAIPSSRDRPASWRRVAGLFDNPPALLDKLPARTVRAAKLRLFRAFKLLGALKQRLLPATADDDPEIRSSR